jgi:hypothetical protein
MKKIMIVSCLFFILSASLVSAEPPQGTTCPKVSQLADTSLQDKEELLKTLNTLIPQVYGGDKYSEKYSEWQVTLAEPMPQLTGFDKDAYYGIAKNFCGEEVAKRSWLVKLHFPLWLPSVSGSQGQIYLTKDKEKGWSVWFRYH